MFGAFYTSLYNHLAPAFSRAARRDSLLGAICRDTAQSELDRAAYNARVLVRRFARDPQVAAPLQAVITHLHQAGRPDIAMDLALQSYRLAAPNSPLQQGADRLARAIADSETDPAHRAGSWGDLARIAPAGSDLQRDAVARWDALVAAMPAAQDRAEACLSLAAMAYGDPPSARRDALREHTAAMAERLAPALADPAARADLFRRAILLLDEFDPMEIRLLSAWDGTILSLPRDQAWQACLNAGETRLDTGRNGSLLLADSAAYFLMRLAAALPPAPEKLAALVTAAAARQVLDDTDDAPATLWRGTLYALPDTVTADEKRALCLQAVLESGPDGPLGRIAFREWNGLTDSLPTAEQKRQVCLDTARAARAWGHDAMAQTLEHKAEALKPVPQPRSPLSPAAFMQRFRHPGP